MSLPGVLLALALALPLSAWALTRSAPPSSPLTCEPFCEVLVEPVGAHQLRATCACGGPR